MSWERRRIDKVKGLDPSIVAAFKGQGMGTAGAIVDEYGRATSQGLAALAKRVDRSEVDTAQVLAGVLEEAAGQLTSNWLARHWADVMVIGAGVFFVIGLLWLPLSRLIVGTLPVVTPHIVAVRDIPDGAAVTEGDVRVAGAGDDGAQALKAVLAGSYASVPIPAGTTILPGMFGGPPAAGQVLTLPVHHIPALGTRKLPLPVGLVFSSRQNAPAGAVFQVALLDATPIAQPTSIGVRLSAKDLAEVAKWIGSSDVTVVFPER
jgi:hypothetical protein